MSMYFFRGYYLLWSSENERECISRSIHRYRAPSWIWWGGWMDEPRTSDASATINEMHARDFISRWGITINVASPWVNLFPFSLRLSPTSTWRYDAIITIPTRTIFFFRTEFFQSGLTCIPLLMMNMGSRLRESWMTNNFVMSLELLVLLSLRRTGPPRAPRDLPGWLAQSDCFPQAFSSSQWDG